jgi:hypothetical protein
MFLSSLPKYICKTASLGLRSLGKANMNGKRFVLKLEFDPKIYTLQSKQGSFLKLIIMSTLYNFCALLFDRIIDQVIIGYFIGLLVKSLCFKRLYNFDLPLSFIKANKLL